MRNQETKVSSGSFLSVCNQKMEKETSELLMDAGLVQVMIFMEAVISLKLKLVFIIYYSRKLRQTIMKF